MDVSHLTDSLSKIRRTDCLVPGFLPFRFSNLIKLKNDLIVGEIKKAENRMHAVDSEQGKVFNAVDHMLHREKQQASKEGRSTQYYSKPMIAEVSTIKSHCSIMGLAHSK